MSSKHFSKVFERYQHRCIYCGRDMLIDFDTFMLTEEDHLFPVPYASFRSSQDGIRETKIDCQPKLQLP